MKKLLKKAGLWAGLFFLVLILVSFLLPTQLKVSRSITVHAPTDRVFHQVNDLRNWENWLPWKRMDPTMVMTYSNPPAGQGAFFKWSSDNKRMGDGTITLVRVVNNEEIVMSLEAGKRGKAFSTFTFANKGSGVEVNWSMEDKLGWWPWSRYFGLIIRSAMKKQFDQGLADLKEHAERS
jgi:uncharacterized protein YndB with AHSA1/START domain